MTTIRVVNTLDDLTSDLASITTTAKPRMAGIVRHGVEFGKQTAQQFARESSGPHGKAYYKRITSEMTGVLKGEFGPTGDVRGRAVGAGWRHGENTDLPRAADLVGPALAHDVHDMLDDQFWPA